ncbi:unnamed protein product [Clonostachys rosea f. rosea IK726]|jgi:hypothetical protein|uniref:Uncharacterized protein n=2 Tax=Bionectria ochroleuca TaxID=29856 RepID=A0A8H7TSS9_BIOOC|nr:unnamed protein product [Clonostachys rosea f. rosea IK726]
MAHQNKAPQQQPQPQPQQQQQQPVSTIPILHSIAPAIFTRITDEDLLAPFTPPTDPVDLLKARLREIEAHAEEVRANLLSLFRRECLRIIQEAEAQEAAAEGGEDGDNTTVHLAPLVSQQEVDDMISNMRRNTGEARDRSRSRVLMQNDIFGQPNMNVLPMRNPREAAVAQIQAVISQGLCDLESYKTKVEELRQQIKSEIDRVTRRQGTDQMDLDF